jgi:hypothetical protein
VTREITAAVRPAIVLSRLDEEAIDRFIASLSTTYVWRSVVALYGRESDGAREPLAHLEQSTQKEIVRMLLEGINGLVSFEGAASLKALTGHGVPLRLMEAIARDAADGGAPVAAPVQEMPFEEDAEEPPSLPAKASASLGSEKASPGRSRFSYRQAYIVEKGSQHLKFRLMGLVNDKETKITVKVYRDRPVRPQLASVEAREGIQFVPMGRVVQVVEKELSRASRRR